MQHPNPDKKLDHLCQEAAENIHLPIAPNWQYMHARLDETMPRNKKRVRFGIWFFSFLLLIMAIVTTTVLWKQHPGAASLQKSTSARAKNALYLSTNINSPASIPTNGDVILKNTSPKNEIKNGSEMYATSTSSSTASTFLGSKKFIQVIKKRNITKLTTKRYITYKKRNIKQPATPQESFPAMAPDFLTDVVTKEVEKNSTIEPPSNSIPANDSTIANKATIGLANTNEKRDKKHNNQAVSIAIMAGSDISTIKFKYSKPPGFQAGLLAGYHFTQRWSVHTGISYTQKNYKLAGRDYHPPKHYWTSYVKLETVDGYCRILEFPVLVRYIVKPGSNNRWVVSAGLSSYSMKQQQYDYYYKNNTGQWGNKSWKTDSAMRYQFSVIHLSTGWEKRFNRGFSLLIEPYGKIPAKGLGFGNIMLSSYGMNFSFQYKHPVRQRIRQV
jgi:hypothetical protein